ncbi:MAG: MobF family relaxase [Burkholderia sp.]
MISNAPIRDPNYYTKEFIRDDYYNKHNPNNKEGIGEWFGRGAAKLNLTGEIKQQDFWKALKGINPNTDEKLSKFVRNNPDRMGQDFTFNANKYFSALLNAYDLNDPMRQELEKIWTEADNFVMNSYENRLLVRENGKLVKCQGAIIAKWQHETSRPENGKIDFQRHCHHPISNYALGSNGKWLAVDFSRIMDDKTLIGSQAQEILANGLQRLGFEITEGKYGFEVKGLPKEAIDYFSGRRNTIVEKAGENSSYRDRQTQANAKQKKDEYNLAELREQWKSKLNDFGINKDTLELLTKQPKQDKTLTKTDIVRHACKLAKSKHFTKEHVEIAMAQKGQAYTFDKDKIRNEILKSRDTRIADKSRFYDISQTSKPLIEAHKVLNSAKSTEFRESLKMGGKSPDREQILKAKDKLEQKHGIKLDKVKPAKAPQKSAPSKPQQGKPAPAKADKAKAPEPVRSTASSLPMSSNHNIGIGGQMSFSLLQQINQISGLLNERLYSLGLMDLNDPDRMEALAGITALREQIAGLTTQKAMEEWKEEEQKRQHEIQQQKNLDKERTR